MPLSTIFPARKCDTSLLTATIQPIRQDLPRSLTHQIKLLENLVITPEEIDFMRSKCYYLPDWFYRYLSGYRFKSEWVKAWQDADMHLHIEIEGAWADTILLEVKILAIISEALLYHDQPDGQLQLRGLL